MKRNTGKTTALFIVSIMALAGVSTGYALWYENLYIDGTVNTGELNWKFTSVAYLDPDYNIPDYHCNPGFYDGTFWMGDKDVGWTYAEVTDIHTITLELNNVYPCYFNMISLYMQATGTIPLIIQSVTVSSDYDEVTITSGTLIFDLDLDGDDNPDIEFWWKDNFFGDQYHPDDYVDEISFWLHIMQQAPQGETLTFTITITAIQYNEYEP